jgi:alanine dehydrogenase
MSSDHETDVLTLDAATVAQRLDRLRLIDALDRGFRTPCTVPMRQRYRVPAPQPGGSEGTLVLMPAWIAGGALGIKIVTVYPDNSAKGLPSVSASYLLMDATTGRPRAMLDGDELTLRRTAAASALASRYLSQPASARLTMIGTGKLAPHLIESHALVRPITEVRIWGRRLERARELAARMRRPGLRVEATEDLETAVRWADLVSCATLSHDPLVRGSWLRAGQHVDLVGSFTPDMAEADDEAIVRSELFVDTRLGALSEAGELVGAKARGVIGADAVRAELADLASGTFARSSPAAITLFKSVGTALEDLVAAQLALE